MATRLYELRCVGGLTLLAPGVDRVTVPSTSFFKWVQTPNSTDSKITFGHKHFCFEDI